MEESEEEEEEGEDRTIHFTAVVAFVFVVVL